MIKKLLRTCVAAGCQASGLIKYAELKNVRALIILCYHRVLPSERKYAYFNPDLAVTPETFHEHCRILKERYEVLPLSSAVKILEKSSNSNRPVVVMTFDDGYQDNYEYAFPVLDKYKLSSTIFPIVDLIGSDLPPWYDRLARAFNMWLTKTDRREEGYIQRIIECDIRSVGYRSAVRKLLSHAKKMLPSQRKEWVIKMESLAGAEPEKNREDRVMDWQQLKEMHDAGHEIGSHSCTHEILTLLDTSSLQYEVIHSRQVLQNRLNTAIRSFCYANGDTDDRVRNCIAAAGYECAVTTIPGNNLPGQDPFRLKRRFIHEDRMTHLLGKKSPLLLRMELCGLADYAFGRSYRTGIRS
jgi:peptidoglycan/xylan/chitin deacetylase (PgdA/CDA1 family)